MFVSYLVDTMSLLALVRPDTVLTAGELGRVYALLVLLGKAAPLSLAGVGPGRSQGQRVFSGALFLILSLSLNLALALVYPAQWMIG